jgi:hypothetical protein
MDEKFDVKRLRRKITSVLALEESDAERSLGVFHQPADTGADTLRSLAAPPMVPVTMTAQQKNCP